MEGNDHSRRIKIRGISSACHVSCGLLLFLVLPLAANASRPLFHLELESEANTLALGFSPILNNRLLVENEPQDENQYATKRQKMQQNGDEESIKRQNLLQEDDKDIIKRQNVLQKDDEDIIKRQNVQAEAARLRRLIGRERESRLFEGEGGRWPALDFSACARASLPKGTVIGNTSSPSLWAPLTSSFVNEHPKIKYFIAEAYCGLGNAFSGLISAYLFALLSGRRLIISIDKGHKGTFYLACTAFCCNPNFFVDDVETTLGDSFAKLKKIRLVDPWTNKGKEDLENLLYDDIPVIISKSHHQFDSYWFVNSKRRNCLFKTFKCSSTNCIFMKVLQTLMNGPREVLGEVIEKHMKGRKGKKHAPSLPRNSLLTFTFDVAVHIRTQPSVIEGILWRLSRDCYKCGEFIEGRRLSDYCEAIRSKCIKEKQDLLLREKNDTQSLVSDQFSKCLGKFFEDFRRKLASEDDNSPILNVFLATDNEALRPSLVKSMGERVVLYFSSGKVSHSGTDDVDVYSRLPTMAEFYLLSTSRYLVCRALGKVSTFAKVAQYYGNNTKIIFDESQESCGFENPF